MRASSRDRRSPRPRGGLLFLSNRQTLLRLPRQALARSVRRALRLAGCWREVPLSLAFVDDRAMRKLHREYRGDDTPTDVLSFPLASSWEGPWRDGEVFGEVVVSVETAVREARRRGHAPSSEVVLYATHGVLHLLGFEDHSRRGKLAMRQAERCCLRAAGIERDLFPGEGEKTTAFTPSRQASR